MRGIEPYRKLRRIYTLGSKVERVGQFEQFMQVSVFAINNKGNSSNPKLRNKPYHGFGRKQRREKLQCLYGNLMSNNFRKRAVLKKI